MLAASAVLVAQRPDGHSGSWGPARRVSGAARRRREGRPSARPRRGRHGASGAPPRSAETMGAVIPSAARPRTTCRRLTPLRPHRPDRVADRRLIHWRAPPAPARPAPPTGSSPCRFNAARPCPGAPAPGRARPAAAAPAEPEVAARDEGSQAQRGRELQGLAVVRLGAREVRGLPRRERRPDERERAGRVTPTCALRGAPAPRSASRPRSSASSTRPAARYTSPSWRMRLAWRHTRPGTLHRDRPLEEPDSLLAPSRPGERPSEPRVRGRQPAPGCP